MILFFKKSVEELKKIQPPSKKETYVTTLVIIVIITAFSLVISLSDFLISETIQYILQLKTHQ